MASTRTKSLFAGGAALLLCLALGALYALGLPPFADEVGDIKASEVCGVLGRSSSSATALKRVLPDRSSYTFDGAVTDPRLDGTDSGYDASCFVNGGGKQLVAVTAEMAQYDKADAWVKDVVANNVPAGSVRPFTAGDKAVASDKVAAVYLPCAARGGGERLSVVVHLKQPRDTGSGQLRDGLITLARNAALAAHQKANCDAPLEPTR